MNPAIQAFEIFRNKEMTPEELFVAGWQACLAFQKANSGRQDTLERSVPVSKAPLGRFADGTGGG